MGDNYLMVKIYAQKQIYYSHKLIMFTGLCIRMKEFLQIEVH
jgi:hypothetical protein